MMFFGLLSQADPTKADISSYYDGGFRLREGMSLYREDIDLTVTDLQYVYPPPLAFFMLVFPNLLTAMWGGAIISLIAFGLAIRLMIAELAPQLAQISSPQRTLGLVGLLFYLPLFHHLVWGQIQLVLLWLIVIAWYCLRHTNDALAGCAFGLAIALKLYPVIFLLPLLAQRRWKAAAWTILSSSAILLGSFMLVGWDQLDRYLNQVLPAVSRQLGGLLFLDNHSINTSLYLWSGSEALASTGSFVFKACLGIVFLGILAKAPRRPDSLVPLAMTMMTMIIPIIWTHYFVLLYLPFSDSFAHIHRHRRQFALLVASYLFISTGPLVQFIDGIALSIIHSLPMIGMLIVFALQARSIFSSPDQAI